MSKDSTMPMPANATATAILILGMHRSGTSAVARMVNLSGADLGRDLLAPKEDNERGFWENAALLSLHEQFLAEIGLQWHDVASLPDKWRDSEAARHFVATLPKLLSQQFDASPLFLVKDPRLSLLTPLWIEVLYARAVRPAFIITVRHPDEVAASLAKRDGFSFARSRLLWLQHLLEAERATRGHPRIFVHYEHLLADWRAERARIATALGLEWPNRRTEDDRQIDAFITPSLRHHGNDARGPSDGPMPQIVQEAYAIASAAASDSSPTPDNAFDTIDSAFDAALQVTGPLIAELSDRMARERERHAQEIERARVTIDGLATEIAQAREAHEGRDRIEAELREAVETRAAEIENARANIDALVAELERAREGFAAKDREIDAAREAIALKEREIDAARRNIDVLIDEVAQARATVSSKDREIDDARQHIATLAADLERTSVAVAAKDVELNSARDNINSLVAQIDQARNGFAAKDGEIDAARINIDALAAEIEQARHAHAERDAVDAALRGELSALRESRWFRLGRKLRLIDRGLS